MMRWLGPWTLHLSRQEAERRFLVASLFALHPLNASQGNLGTVFARLRALQGASESLDRRLVALLRAHAQDLPGHLRRVVSLARGHGIPLNWAQLLTDLRGWSHRGRHVQLAWARAYWVAEPGLGTPHTSDLPPAGGPGASRPGDQAHDCRASSASEFRSFMS